MEKHSETLSTLAQLRGGCVPAQKPGLVVPCARACEAPWRNFEART